MRKFLFFIIIGISSKLFCQNISGVINAYANVTNIAGVNITVGGVAGFAIGDQVLLIQMKGAAVQGGNVAAFGNITALNSAGMYEFLDIVNIAGNVITVNTAPLNPYNTANGSVQLVTVPKYCLPVVNNTLTCSAWNGTIGGVLAFEAGTLTLNSDINVTGNGFRGGNFTSGGFGCNSNIFAAGGNAGGQKGESISSYIVNFDKNKANQANGGGGSNNGNSGGGGGGNGGPGGRGGNQYNGCGNAVDERGVGGLLMAPNFARMFLGGGGGGGFRDNNQVATAGQNGGGIIYIRANAIICNNRVIASNGASVTIIANDEGSGGGGAGGSIFISCNNYIGNLTVLTNGGRGGSNNNTIFPGNCHGPGGGGGGGLFVFSPAVLPGSITYISNGGAAGTVNNPASACFNTTFGAQPGTAGVTLANFPAPVVAVNQPTITVAGNNTICPNETTTLTASGASSYTWNPPAILTATAALNPNATTIYTIIGSSGACTAQVTHTVYTLPGPTLNVAGNTTLCAGETSTLFASGAQTYTWNSSVIASSLFINPIISTNYTLEGTDMGCTSSTVIPVQVNPNPTVFITPLTVTICAGQMVNLSAVGAVSYTWSPGASLSNTFAANVTANPLTTTNYSVIGSVNNCTAIAVRQVSVIALPDLVVTVSKPQICSGDITALNANGASSYSWAPTFGVTNPNSGFTQANPSTSTSYTVYASNGACSTSSIVSVMVVPNPVLNLSAYPTKICSGDKASIFASGANTFVWSPADDNFTLINNNMALVSPSVNTNYTVTAVNSAGSISCVMTQEILIEVLPPVLPAVSGSVNICKGQTVRIHVNAESEVTWLPTEGLDNPNTAHPYANPESTTVYTVYASYSGFCRSTSTVMVKVNPVPEVNAGADITMDNDEVRYIYAVGSGSITWIAGEGIACHDCPQTQITPVKDGCYTALSVNQYGCTATDEVCVKVNNDHGIFIPSVFTPNEDGLNDVFLVQGYGVTKVEIKIFDRWGALLFSTTDRFTGWDGTYKGEYCKQDAYVYKVSYTSVENKKYTRTGHVTLLK